MPDDFIHRLAEETEGQAQPERAPATLKSRLYSALVEEQQREGPLRALDESASEGRKLCVFEQFVAIAPLGQKAKSIFYCKVCHARVLAETFDSPPIYWPNCPYVAFKHK
jgi:hypothetical protein